MRKRGSLRKTSPILSFLERQIFVKAHFSFFWKIFNFQPLENEEREVLSLAIFLTKMVAIAYLSGLAGGYFTKSMSPETANLMNISLVALLPLIISLDVVKQRVGMTVEAFSRFSNDSQLVEKRTSSEELEQEYFLSRITCSVDGETLGTVRDLSQLELDGLSRNLFEKIYSRGINEFQSSLEIQFKQSVEKREIKCVLLNISDEDFFRPVSLIACMHAFNTSDRDMFKKGTEYNVFWQDIYYYLKAWLVCSIESETGNPMPINLIGLNYPDKHRPNKAKYTKAIAYIGSFIGSDKEAMNQLNNHQPTIKRMQNGLTLLLRLIEDL